MSVLAVLGAVAVLAVVAGYAFGAAVMLAVPLRVAHEQVARSRWFALVRRHGIRKAIAANWRSAGRGRGRIRHVLYDMRRHGWMALLVIPLVAFLLPMMPWLAFMLLMPASRQPKEPAGYGIYLLTISILCVIFVCRKWLLGLHYIAHPDTPKRADLPNLHFPQFTSRHGRNCMALNVYWYKQRHSAVMFAAMYPWLILLPYIPWLEPSNQPSSTHAETASTDQMPPLLAMLILVAVVMPSMLPALVLEKRLERRMVPLQTTLAILAYLNPPTTPDAPNWEPIPIVPDPFAAHRSELASLAAMLTATADRLDVGQPPSFTPLPVSTLLRGCSRMLHSFLTSRRALAGALPSEITELLTLTATVLVGPRDNKTYLELAATVSAFDDNGDPAVELHPRPPGKIAVLTNRFVNAVERAAGAAGSLGGLVALAIAIMLAVVGQMRLEGLLGFLKK